MRRPPARPLWCLFCLASVTRLTPRALELCVRARPVDAPVRLCHLLAGSDAVHLIRLAVVRRCLVPSALTCCARYSTSALLLFFNEIKPISYRSAAAFATATARRSQPEALFDPPRCKATRLLWSSNPTAPEQFSIASSSIYLTGHPLTQLATAAWRSKRHEATSLARVS